MSRLSWPGRVISLQVAVPDVDAAAVHCPTCRYPRRMVSIRVKRGDITLVMHACSACDTVLWERDGERIPLREAMASAPSAE